ncbi:MAG: hypothetical protein V1765_03045 [bacterium]
MLLYRKPTVGEFSELFNKAKTGDTILLYQGPYDEYKIHSQGVIIRRGGRFSLNGKTALKESDWYYQDAQLKNPVIRKGDCFFLRGVLLYEGDWDNFKPHPRGVIIKKDKQLLLNGRILLYEGKWDNWLSHANGVIITKSDELWLAVYKIRP